MQESLLNGFVGLNISRVMLFTLNFDQFRCNILCFPVEEKVFILLLMRKGNLERIILKRLLGLYQFQV